MDILTKKKHEEGYDMTRFAMILGGLMLAAPAMAHEAGAHMHPHGAESWLALLPAAALIVTAVLLARGRR